MAKQHRKFDWSKAKRMLRDGKNKTEIARHFGVSWRAVHMAVDDKARKHQRAMQTKREYGGVCPDCGGRMYRGVKRCRACDNKRKATSVRPDSLRCSICREWKPDGSFYKTRISRLAHRRYRTRICIVCQRDAALERRRIQREKEAMTR